MPAVESDRRRGDLALLLALQRLLHDRSELWEPERPRRHVWGVHSGLGRRHGRQAVHAVAVKTPSVGAFKLIVNFKYERAKRMSLAY